MHHNYAFVTPTIHLKPAISGTFNWYDTVVPCLHSGSRGIYVASTATPSDPFQVGSTSKDQQVDHDKHCSAQTTINT